MALGPLGCVTLDEIEAPALPGNDWVRVQTTLSGICGSDLSAVTAHDSFTLEPFGAYPFVFGHENVGRVAEVGPGADGWQPGDRVIVNPMLSCLQRGLEPCAACARGEYGLCRRTNEGVVGRGPMIGYNPRTGGGWSGGFVAHSSQLHRADGLSDEVAVLADPFVSALRPVLLHPPADDDVVLVIGAGSIGLLTIVALRAAGFEGTIAALGRYGFQFEKAEAAGADVLLRNREELYQWAGGLPGAVAYKPTLAGRFVEGGPSIVYDTVGSETTIGDGVALTREGGKLILVGGAAKTSVDWTRVWYRQITLAGIFAYGLAPFEGERRDIYETAIELLRRRDYGELGLLTHVFELEDYRAALHAALSKGGHRSIKVAIRPDVSGR
ncbi:MAG TPA: alcohol dehydrogenase catalytic domain-containing protein [Longimicrobiales bacterium]|nr:alcohol dehydrogenase catalytic domain-containing protein [Longimicrobiales bacterium]